MPKQSDGSGKILASFFIDTLIAMSIVKWWTAVCNAGQFMADGLPIPLEVKVALPCYPGWSAG